MTAFIEPRSDESVAVLRSGDVVAVLGVFACDAVVILHGKLWDAFLELLELLKERFLWIVGETIVLRIPSVAPPARDAVDGVDGVTTMRGHNLLRA